MKIGDRVLCISDDFDPTLIDRPPSHKGLWPVQGLEYTVARLNFPNPDWSTRPPGLRLGIVLEELDYSPGFDARAFKVL